MNPVADFINAITRPLVTVICISGLTVGFFVGLISGDVYGTIVTAIIIYWFKQRDSDAAQGELATKAAESVVAQTVERRGDAGDAPVARRAAARERNP